MSDFDDSLFPQDPEIEYACDCGESREGYYGTGSTTPPKDYVGVIALVLVLFISLSGAISILSLMNIEILKQPEPTQLRSPVSFYVSGDGVMTAVVPVEISVSLPLFCPAVLTLKDSRW